MLNKTKLNGPNLILAAMFTLTLLSSFRTPRAWISVPLLVHEPNATGSVAYVMSGGPASFERLLAASDLFHMRKVSEVALANEEQNSCYNYSTRRSESRSERCIAYLMMRGVPRDRIRLVPLRSTSRLGSLREAQSVAKELKDIKELVVVTSAAHTRRTAIAFARSLPEGAKIQTYAASPLIDSDEIFSPVWIEYLKLAVYFSVA